MNYLTFTFLVLICLSMSGCKKEKILTIGDAENQTFNAEGRLFVSSIEGIYEVVRDETGEFELKPLLENGCTFQGIVSARQYLITVCGGGSGQQRRLLYSDRETNYTLWNDLLVVDELRLPNGIAYDGYQTLYLANSPYLAQGSVAKLVMDFGAQYLEVISFQPRWKSAMHGVRNPNGIKWHDDRLYVTDWGQVKSFDSLEADSKAKVLYSRVTVFDDLLVHCDHLLVTDFFAGTVIAMNFSGQHIYETPPTWMPGASSVLVAREPLFSRPGLLVTERGILLEPESKIGNQLSFFSSESFQEKIPDCLR